MENGKIKNQDIVLQNLCVVFVILRAINYLITALTAEQEWTVTEMDKTCSNCKHAIGFGPQHDKAIYAFCEKRSDVAKIKFLIVNRKNKCNAWEKRSDEDNA